MFNLQLSWKEFPVNLNALEAHCREAYPAYLGNSADSKLTLHFSDEVSEDDKASAQAYWDAIESDSEEATSWKSQADLKAEAAASAAALKASGKAKLIALGLSEEEASAIAGV